MMATIGYYLRRLSKSCQYIIKCRYLENMGWEDIAKNLNQIQKTRSYNSKRIEEIYIKNLKIMRKYLKKATLIRE